MAPLAGRAGKSPCGDSFQRSCKFCCTSWRPRRDAVGSVSSFPPPLSFRLHFSLDSNFSFCRTRLMPVARETVDVQGRVVTMANLEQIRQLLAAHPGWSRRRLSEVLAAEWNWRKAAG